MVSLVLLDLSGKNIKKLPAEIDGCTSLTRLNIGSNAIPPCLPPKFHHRQFEEFTCLRF
jgi:hypothetical protein